MRQVKQGIEVHDRPRPVQVINRPLDHGRLLFKEGQEILVVHVGRHHAGEIRLEVDGRHVGPDAHPVKVTAQALGDLGARLPIAVPGAVDLGERGLDVLRVVVKVQGQALGGSQAAEDLGRAVQVGHADVIAV